MDEKIDWWYDQMYMKEIGYVFKINFWTLIVESQRKKKTISSQSPSLKKGLETNFE